MRLPGSLLAVEAEEDRFEECSLPGSVLPPDQNDRFCGFFGDRGVKSRTFFPLEDPDIFQC